MRLHKFKSTVRGIRIATNGIDAGTSTSEEPQNGHHAQARDLRKELRQCTQRIQQIEKAALAKLAQVPGVLRLLELACEDREEQRRQRWRRHFRTPRENDWYV